MDIQKARQNATRSRTAFACTRYKAGKIKCSDYRPCKHCINLVIADSCMRKNQTASTSATSGNLNGGADILMYSQPFEASDKTENEPASRQGIIAKSNQAHSHFVLQSHSSHLVRNFYRLMVYIE